MSRKSALRPRYLKLHAVLVFAFLFLPIVVLVFFSFNHARSGTDFTGFSTHWYSELVHNHEALQAFRNTLKVAIIGDGHRDRSSARLASFALSRASSSGAGPATRR